MSDRETTKQSIVAYFSMEIGLDSSMPTYSGGLGVLAGDALKAAADVGLAMVGVTLLPWKGYFRQHLDKQGNQTESPVDWDPKRWLTEMPQRTVIDLFGRQVFIRAWRYSLQGLSGHPVPILFLDTSLPENREEDRRITDHLYGGDERYRLAQEAILGLGGLEMLRSLGYTDIAAYHMNEGHASLLTIALLQEQCEDRGIEQATDSDRDAVRHRCVFTTHTPVLAGHDRFTLDTCRFVLGDSVVRGIQANGSCPEGVLNMTLLALNLSRYINGVSLRHEKVSLDMFPEFPIYSITNGVHVASWATEPFSALFDRHMPEWRKDNRYLRHAARLSLDDIQQAHDAAKRRLLQDVNDRTGRRLVPEAFTIGFARRATLYKRLTLLFTDLDRLEHIARVEGPIQIILSGKAHPRDWGGKDAIRQVISAAHRLKDAIDVVYLEEYDMDLGKLMCGGVDLWLNTPQKPMEASGTSGMKAAVNGVPSLSVLDGWWIEGHLEGVTGWAIGSEAEEESDPSEELESLYDKLQFVILPMFYGRSTDYARVMRSSIVHNASFFNAQRMMMQYALNAYDVVSF
jgi:glycogen phosphorylase